MGGEDGVGDGEGNVEFVNPASRGEEGKTSRGEALCVLGERERSGRSRGEMLRGEMSRGEMSRGEVAVFMEGERMEVVLEVVMQDVVDEVVVEEEVEEDVNARRRRASGIVCGCVMT